MKYIDNLYTLSHDSTTSDDTSPALISAVLKQENATEIAEGPASVSRTKRTRLEGPTTTLTPQVKIIETEVFLDSGCLGSSYIREDVAHAIAKHKPHLFTPCITNVCGAFGQCELSKKKMFVKLSILCNDVSKVFITELKVLKNLPYEIILGRKVMIENDLTFEKGTPTGAPRTPLIATMKGGHTPTPPPRNWKRLHQGYGWEPTSTASLPFAQCTRGAHEKGRKAPRLTPKGPRWYDPRRI